MAVETLRNLATHRDVRLSCVTKQVLTQYFGPKSLSGRHSLPASTSHAERWESYAALRSASCVNEVKVYTCLHGLSIKLRYKINTGSPPAVGCTRHDGRSHWWRAPSTTTTSTRQSGSVIPSYTMTSVITVLSRIGMWRQRLIRQAS
eukprot:1194926-Prorocentrum_minimum.AAC.5